MTAVPVLALLVLCGAVLYDRYAQVHTVTVRAAEAEATTFVAVLRDVENTTDRDLGFHATPRAITAAESTGGPAISVPRSRLPRTYDDVRDLFREWGWDDLPAFSQTADKQPAPY